MLAKKFALGFAIAMGPGPFRPRRVGTRLAIEQPLRAPLNGRKRKSASEPFLPSQYLSA